MRIVVLGGGFGGVATVRHLERRCARAPTSRSRSSAARTSSCSHRCCSRRAREGWSFVTAPSPSAPRSGGRASSKLRSKALTWTARSFAPSTAGRHLRPPYDHLVVALGASTNEKLIPGSSTRVHVQDDGGCVGAEESPDRTVRTRRRRGRLDEATGLSYGRRDRRRPRRRRAAGRAHRVRRRRAPLLSAHPSRRNAL